MIRVRFGISDENEGQDYIQYFKTEEEADEAMEDWVQQDNAWASATQASSGTFTAVVK